jgi:MinD-like ATPase involved in chromosome partitioning or flagellar assembly
MSGFITTFYSYKGGVGRSCLLANIAALLSRWGFRVLCVDWDVEAPGLDEYFRPWASDEGLPGLVDLVADHLAGDKVDWRKYVSPVGLPQSAGRLAFMSAGRSDVDYMTRVQKVDWRLLFENANFGEFLEGMREDWKSEYDFVLIDSRTGITDIGGICTVHLPDLLVAVFATNRQSIDGVVKVVSQAQRQRDRLPLNRAGLMVLPVPSRFDSRVQDELANEWLRTLAASVEQYYDTWLDVDVTPRQMVDHTRIPYFSSASFGERLCVLEERENDTEGISYHFATVAALIAHRLENTDLLVRGRDVFVDAARAMGRRNTDASFDFFMSYSTDVAGAAHDVARLLKQAGRSVWLDTEQIAAGEHWMEERERALEHCREYIFCVSPTRVSHWQAYEASLVSNLSLSRERRIIPIFFGEPTNIPPPLHMFAGIDARVLSPQQIVARIVPGRSLGGAEIDAHLRTLALRYAAVEGSYETRTLLRDALASDMAAYALNAQTSRERLARSADNGLIVALAEATLRAPEPGDLDRLLQAASKIGYAHAACRVLTAIAMAAERERVSTSDRERLDDTLRRYTDIATVRRSSRLLSLVTTVRRRLANVT